MESLIQGQKDWKEFSINGNIGIVTTFFSEQLLSSAYDLIHLSHENFREEISLYGIDTVFIDNVLFEADHEWYKQSRGHIVNHCKNNGINLVVIKNTSTEVNQTFKKAFVMEINPHINKYKLNELVLEVPMLLDTNVFNPINSKKNRDITYYSVGKMQTSPEIQAYNSKFKPSTRIVAEPRFTRHSLKKLSSYIQKSKILYINNATSIDKVTLQYIEYMALLNTTYVMYDYNIEVSPSYGFQSYKDNINASKLRLLLANNEYWFKTTLKSQREVLINNTFLLMPNLNDYLNQKLNKLNLPSVSIITSTNRKKNLDFYFKQMNKQAYVDLEINLVTHGYELSEKEKIYFSNECKFEINFLTAHAAENLGLCLNKAIDISTKSVIAKIDDDDYYLEHYIIDQWLAMQYSRADVVGKSEAFYYFESENIIAKRKVGEYLKYDTFIMGATIMSRAEMMKKLMFADLPKAVDTNYLRRVIAHGGEIYIGHPYEMCVYRSGDDNHHTWNVNELTMLKNAKVVGFGSPESHVRI